jgi:putative oxidoreductase
MTAMIYNFLYPQYCRDRVISVILLAVRVFFGVLFFMHGVDKMMNFSSLSESFPSVLGFGSYMSLMVAVFCEFCCSLFLVAGLLQRLILIPMIISMGVAFFGIHDAILPDGELALIYFVVFIILFLTGPGRYSIDYLLDNKFRKYRKTNEDK